MHFLAEFAFPRKKRQEALQVTVKDYTQPDAQAEGSGMKRLAAHDQTHIGKEVSVSLHKGTAKRMAADFFSFVDQHHLQEYLRPLKATPN